MSDENRPQDEQLNKYRLVIMNDETFEEISSFQVSKPKVYLAVFGILFGVTILVWTIITFTPLKNLLFGNGDHNIRQEMVKHYIHVDSLEKALADRDHYIENMRAVLTGNLETSAEVAQSEVEKRAEQKLAEANAAELEQARKEAAKREAENKDKQLDLSANRDDSLLRARLARDKDFSIPEKNDGKEANAIKVASTKYVEENISELYFTPPIKGFITADFQPARKHYGVDVAAPKNTAIKSTMDGVVIVSDWTLETGNIIGIQHDNNLVSFYKHNSVLLKKVGSFVKAGEAVAIIGNTGQLSDGPHLHFELWHNGEPLNPTNYTNF